MLYNVRQLIKERKKNGNIKQNNLRHKRQGTNWNSTKEEKNQTEKNEGKNTQK